MDLLRCFLIDPGEVVGLLGPPVCGDLEQEERKAGAVEVRVARCPRDAVVAEGRDVICPGGARFQGFDVSPEHGSEGPRAEVVEVGAEVRVGGEVVGFVAVVVGAVAALVVADGVDSERPPFLEPRRESRC